MVFLRWMMFHYLLEMLININMDDMIPTMRDVPSRFLMDMELLLAVIALAVAVAFCDETR